MADLPSLLPEHSVLVVNDSRVRKARLFGRSEDTGSRVELLLVERIDGSRWEVLLSKARKQKPNKRILLPEGRLAIVESIVAERRVLLFDPPVDDEYLERCGHVPLPPYIKREDDEQDAQRYQTVYAGESGSVAAPTAGLHLTTPLLDTIREIGVDVATVTLHVGVGTFAPIRSESIEDHSMHTESYTISPETAEQLNQARILEKPVIAVGTTVVRTLESAWHDGAIRSGSRTTDLFITPGYDFRVVGGMLTNFHTPRSSLLVLVSAFAGVDIINQAYKIAVDQEYQLFSYGDAMLIL